MKLVIRISRSALSFSALTGEGALKIDYEPCQTNPGIAMAANLRQAVADCRLPKTFNDEAVVMVDSPVLLIPVEEFDVASAPVLYRRIFTGSDADSIMTTVLPGESAVAAYAVNPDLRLVVDDNFRSSVFMPLMQPVWNYMHKRSYTGNRQKLFCYFRDKCVDVACFRQNRFKFSNRFDASRTYDAAYFVLNVWQQLGMDSSQDEIHLAGTLPGDGELAGLLREYVRNVYELDLSGEAAASDIDGLDRLPFDLQTFYAIGR